MKIVIDDKIPYIREAVAALGVEAVYLPGAKITADDVKDADALIIRTRTRCDETLLAGSKVQFVGTATIGYDHIDTDYLKRAGIAWTNCPGCNASSVAQYIHSALLLVKRNSYLELRGATVGIVGCGRVGSLVKKVCEKMGMKVLVCDPPREERERHMDSRELKDYLKANNLCPVETYSTLNELKSQCHIITFHVPLVSQGPHPTYHLADRNFFRNLDRVPIIINTSRGEVVDNKALCAALDNWDVRFPIIDTWENEPNISRKLLDKVFIGTPHIAGYSADGKVNADNMVLEALCRHFGITPPAAILPPPLPEDSLLKAPMKLGEPRRGYAYGDYENLEMFCMYTSDMTRLGAAELRQLALYNPMVDSRRLKSSPKDFERLRGDYPLRREKQS